MTPSFCLLTNEDLARLAAALRSGRLSPPFSPLLLQRYVPGGLAGRVATELQQRVGEGAEAKHLADCLEILCQDRRQRPTAEDLIDLVWTGPEAPGIVNRDTSVVVREMFQSARESVLVAGYAVYQGHVVFKELAERMDQSPELQVQMYLDVQRPPHDHSSPLELIRIFADRFIRKEWPGRRLPRLYYDPRSLEMDQAKRASLHAKCVVVDKEHVYISSANFTAAAQRKNIELGVHLVSESLARRVVQHFEALAEAQLVKQIPMLGVIGKEPKVKTTHKPESRAEQN
jgi:phosphatidylserine/phosphatidylglycerophosphate/cardiolipin synthase-like enzyme